MDGRLAATLAEVFGLKRNEIHMELARADVGTWDSLKQMDLVLSLENAYGVAFEIDDILGMTSVAAIVGVLRSKGVELGD